MRPTGTPALQGREDVRVLVSFLLQAVATGPLRVAEFQGIASAWAWSSCLLASAPHSLPLPSFTGLGPSVWLRLPSLFLTVSGFFATLILGILAWLAIRARCGLAR
jgi:hypothetical protein